MSEPSAVQRFFGAALIGVGVLMMVLCGGCGALFLVSFLVSAVQSPNAGGVGMAIFPLVMGGLPTLVGLGLFLIGRDLRRPKRPPAVDRRGSEP